MNTHVWNSHSVLNISPKLTFLTTTGQVHDLLLAYQILPLDSDASEVI